MNRRFFDWSMALLAGFLLTLMIDFNSLVAKQSSPLIASWIAHGIGSLTSLALVLLASKKFYRPLNLTSPEKQKNPLWSYFGGLPGAFTVVLATIAVNSELGIASVIALMLVGQIAFGIISDLFGLFGLPKRRLVIRDYLVMTCVLLGSGLIIFMRP